MFIEYKEYRTFCQPMASIWEEHTKTVNFDFWIKE